MLHVSGSAPLLALRPDFGHVTTQPDPHHLWLLILVSVLRLWSRSLQKHSAYIPAEHNWWENIQHKVADACKPTAGCCSMLSTGGKRLHLMLAVRQWEEVPHSEFRAAESRCCAWCEALFKPLSPSKVTALSGLFALIKVALF